MWKTGKKWPRYFAIVLALIMLLETIAFTMTGYAKNNANTVYELNNEDKGTVTEISNMTGVKADEITRLRKEGKSWNEILELIKHNPGYKAEGDGTRRNDTLAKTGIEEDTLLKLKEEGFTEEEIVEVKSLVERVIFQLDEIVNMQTMTPSQTEVGVNINENKEDMTAYTALKGKINLNAAAYLVLKLRDELGGMQGALDEYLCSLQLGIDLNLYLTDKEEYQKQKQQKLVELASQEIITAAGLEEKMLDMLQNANKKEEEIPVTKADIPEIPAAITENPLPTAQAPDVQNIKPQNPAEAILQEIENVKSSGIEPDRR